MSSQRDEGTTRRTLLLWVFPAQVITEVISSQPWFIGGFQPGQLLGWLDIGLFALVVFKAPRVSTWSRALVLTIFVAKVGTWLSGLPQLDLLYRVSLVSTAALVGAMCAVEQTPAIRQQASIMMIVAAPLMFLQAAGAGAWTQVLTTHGIQADGTSVSKEGTPALFAQTKDLVGLGVQNVQSRPAGFFHASEFASLIIIFSLVLILASRGRRWRAAELAVAVAAVLSMAKIVLLTALVAVAWIVWKGEPSARQRARSMGVQLLICLVAYRVVFPGLFEANLAKEAFVLSFFSRAHDIITVLGFGALADRQVYMALETQVAFAQGESLSGIGQIVRYLPVFLAMLVVGGPLMLIAYRRTRVISSGATQLASTMLFAVSLFLIAGPFIKSTAFWYCMGFGLFPLLALVSRNYLADAISRIGARYTFPNDPGRIGAARAEPA